jgi:cytochrome c oxidase subunit 2
MSFKDLFGLQEPLSEHGGGVDHMIVVVHIFMALLFVGWTAFFFYTLWRFAARRAKKADYTGVRNHVSTHLEIGVVIIEAVLLLGFAIPMWRDRTDSFTDIQKQDPTRVRAIGYQFAWNYHYPGKDGKFGRIDRHLISNAGDPCIDPDDPNGYDDFTSASLKTPAGRPCIVQVTSTDVIHNYAIVPMRVQQDAIPGTDIPMWFTPLKPLETHVVCAQLCGDQHANMRGLLEVVPEGTYQAWATEQSEAAYERNTKDQDSQIAIR